MIKLKFLGAGREVGRSAFLLDFGEKILLEYGVKLGPGPTLYPAKIKSHLDAVIISHAHLDHSGNLPELFLNKASSMAYMTLPTLDIAKVLWHDSLKIADYEGLEATFSKQEIERTEAFTFPLSYNKKIRISENCVLEFFDAGHIIGSAISKLQIRDKSLLYTGDFKVEETRLFKGADLGEGEADFVIIESTYGDREHPKRKEVEKEFIENVLSVLEKGGTVLVPAFALGRSQEIVDVLFEYRVNYPIFFDGMSQKIAQISLQYPTFLKNAKFLKKALQSVYWIDKKNRNKALKEPSVIVSSAGMLAGGPAIYYLKKIWKDPKSAIFLTGYQVEGTPGRILLETGKIELDKKIVEVQAKVKKFDFSAHPGQSEMIQALHEWNPQKIFLVHGDNEVVDVFLNRLKEEGFDAVGPRNGEEFELK